MITLAQIKETLQNNKTELVNKYGVRTIAIFGSYGRGQQTDESDVDILVDFNKPIGIAFIDLANDLERLLNLRVDLVSKNGIKPNYMKEIEKELNYV
ncbi:MAG: nucleotidyltransferase family protein [Bacteroidota bacterium]|jgi:predicted nucleotidyltransferase|nr:nucleotidyltransferase family protein [Sphingobacteriales bacterium]